MKPRTLGAGPCNNKYIKSMLVPYAERTLAKSNRAEVEAHLNECPSCRDKVRRLRELMRPLSELAKSGFKPVYDAHPDHEQLFKYAYRDSRLDSSERKYIDLHVFMCEDCRREISLIEQVNADFDSSAPGDSFRWIMPPVLRDLFAPPNRTSAIVENALESRIPDNERLKAIMQKINLRLVGILAAIVLLIFICLSFITCGDSESEVSAEAIPSPNKVSTVASPEVKTENWTALPLDNFSPVEACELLNAQNIKYRSVRGRLEVLAADVDKAQAVLRQPVEPEPSEALASADYVPEVAETADNGNDSQAYEASSDQSSEAYTGTNDSDNTSTDDYAGGETVEPQSATTGVSDSAVEKSPEPSAPKRKAVPVKKFSQPRVAAPQQRTAVRPVYSAQPRVKAKVASRPVRTYDAASYQPAPAPAAAIAKASPKANPGTDPTPISASYRYGNNSSDSSPRSLAAPTPQTIHPGVDVTVSSLPRRSAQTEDHNVETAASVGSSQGGDVIISGNTYDETDSVTSREEIEE
ncbi:MAG: zf-HC2 domain-containing protein [Candidatus Bruticola sp.]